MLPASAFAQVSPSTLQGRNRAEEAKDLQAFAEKTHPRGLEAARDPDWQRRWAELQTAAHRLTDSEYFVSVRRVLGWFKDGHTTLLPFEFVGGVPDQLKSGPFSLALPIQVRAFHDGVFVTGADAANESLLGAKLIRIGSLTAEEIMRRIADRWPGNDAWAHRQSGWHFGSPAMLQGIGAVRDPTAAVPVEFGLGAGVHTTMITPRPAPIADRKILQARTSARQDWAKDAGGGNYVRTLPDRHAIYISIDEMGDTKAANFDQLTRNAFEALSYDYPQRVIIDLRRNGGGNNYLAEPLRKRLGASRFNQPGGLYVLISPFTFSAAQNLANRLERETFAHFVGEPTGGAPNHYGDAKLFKGESTGMTAIVSSLPWFDSYPQDQRQWIMPDHSIPVRFDDWRSGLDLAFEFALTHQAAPGGDENDRNRVFYFDRPSQKMDWKPFWLG